MVFFHFPVQQFHASSLMIVAVWLTCCLPENHKQCIINDPKVKLGKRYRWKVRRRGEPCSAAIEGSLSLFMPCVLNNINCIYLKEIVSYLNNSFPKGIILKCMIISCLRWRTCAWRRNSHYPGMNIVRNTCALWMFLRKSNIYSRYICTYIRYSSDREQVKLCSDVVSQVEYIKFMIRGAGAFSIR